MKEKKLLNVQIGERIKSARETAGYTQERFAELIDVSVQYVSDLERGVVGTSIPTLIKICTVLCISSDSLLFPRPMPSDSDHLCDFTIQFQGLDEQQQKVLRKSIQVTFEAFQCTPVKEKSH